jgi:hypothetical protein
LGTLISKNSRRITGAVEDLKQGSFTATKGIDETAPALSSDTVLHSVNLDVDRDGGLVLRKPLIAAKVFPKYYFYAPTHIIPITDNILFLIYQTPSCAGCILDYTDPTAPKPVSITLEWVRYDNYLEMERSDVPIVYTSTEGYVFYNLSVFDLNTITFANLATNVLVYGAKVYFKNSLLCDEKTSEDGGTVVQIPTLIYEDMLDSSVNTITRPLQIMYMDKAATPYVKIKISYAELTELTPEGDIPLDANLNLDAPYALRDGYNKASCNVNGILAYSPAQLVDGEVVPKPELVENTEPSKLDTYTSLSDDNAFLTHMGAMYYSYRDLSSFSKSFTSYTSKDVLGLHINIGLGSKGGEVIRGGVLKCVVDSDIQYVDCERHIAGGHSGQVIVNQDAIESENYTSLCKITCDFKADVTSQDDTFVQAMSLKQLQFKIPINVEWNSKGKAPLIEEFDTKVNSQYPEESDVPLISYNYLNPALWDNFKNCFLETLIARCLGYDVYKSGGIPFSWTYVIDPNNSNETAHVVEHFKKTSQFIYLIVYRYAIIDGGYIGAGMHPDSAVCFRIPSTSFNLTLEDVTVQGHPPFDVSLL